MTPRALPVPESSNDHARTSTGPAMNLTAPIVAAARRAVAGRAHDAADARRLLAALGIGPGWQEPETPAQPFDVVTRRYPDSAIGATRVGWFV